MELSADDA